MPAKTIGMHDSRGVMLSLASLAATPAGNAGSKYFEQALRSLKDGTASDAHAAADKGWAALLAAGPASE